MEKAPALASEEGYRHAFVRSLPMKCQVQAGLASRHEISPTEMYTGINCKPLASNFCTISLPSAHAEAYTNTSAHKSEQNQLPVPALFHPHLAFAETLYFMAL